MSPGLVIALTFAFGLFNELLFASLGTAVDGEGSAEVAVRLKMVSLAVGGVLLLAGAGFVLFSRDRRWSDAVAGALAIAAGACLGWLAWRQGAGLVVWYLLVVNVLLAGWLSRGWMLRSFAARRDRT